MKNRIKISLLIISLAVVCGCESEMINYEGGASIYFKMQIPPQSGYGEKEIWEHVDTSRLPFSTTIEDDSVFTLRFKVIGDIVDYDRQFKLEIASTSTAVEGREYALFEKAQIVKAGTDEAYVAIHFQRTDELLNNHLYLTLNLVPTTDFSLSLKEWKRMINSYNTKDINVVQHTIDLSNSIFRPNIWTETVWDVYSDYKFWFVTDFFGLTQSEFENREIMPFPREKYLGMSLNKYLKEKEAAGTPEMMYDMEGNIVYEKDADGNYVLDENGQKIHEKLKLGWLVQ